MEEKKKLLKNWRLWVGIIILIAIIVIISIFILRNKLTSEETVSRFMYLVENKNYEEAKKLCDNDLEKLDILSNVKPSNLTFTFSEDKKNATSTLLEEEIEVTKLNVTLKNTIMGWKIQNYEVTTDLIEPQEIEDRLKTGKNVTDIQLLYWGESDIASKDEIAQYIEDNAMVAMIFAETMKAKNYDKANEMYKVISENDLTVDNLQEYDWSNYEITSNFKIMEGPNGDFSSITIQFENKKIWIYVSARQITSIKEATI